MAKRGRNIDKNMNNMQTKNSNFGDSSSNTDEHPPPRKRRKHDTEGIAMSKQLQMKLKAKSDTSNRKKTKSNRVCGNGKPLPSLKDLELLFQDSDEDDSDKRLETNTVQRADSPEIIVINDPDTIFSPTTRARITQQAKQILASNSKQNGNQNNSPVKEESPMMDGWGVDCIAKDKYELCDLTLSSDESQDDNVQQNYSQSTSKHKPEIFKHGPYNISQDLIEQTAGRRISSDSDNISKCALANIPFPSKPNTNLLSEAFEPLPSTSRDNETFAKNVELFNERLKKIAKTKNGSLYKEDEVLEVIEMPVETVTATENPEPEHSKTTFDEPEMAGNFTDHVIEIDSDIINLPVLNNSKNELDTDPGIYNKSAINTTDNTHKTDIPPNSTLNKSNAEIQRTVKVSKDDNDIDLCMQNQLPMNNEHPILNMSTSNNFNNDLPESIYIDDDDVCLIPEPKSNGYHSPTDNLQSVMNNNTNNIDDTPIETIDLDALIAQNQNLLNKYQSKRSSGINSIIDVTTTPESLHNTEKHLDEPLNFSTYDASKQKCKKCRPLLNVTCRCRHARLYVRHERSSEKRENQTQENLNAPNHDTRPSNAQAVLNIAEQQQQLDTNQISDEPANGAETVDTETDPITTQKQLTTSDLYAELMTLEQQALVPNTENFECEICTDEYLPGCGVVLRECVHIFCKECLADVVRHCEETEIACPALGCQGKLQQREIRALGTPQDYEKWLARGLAAAESGTRNAFHCRTRDCSGWALCETGVRIFPCPVCKQLNCVPCQAIHDDETCEQYQYRLQNDANNKSNAETDEKTRKLLNTWITKGKAMQCPECSVVLMKTAGCDWIKCSACKTEICWATRGRRWGPRGRGDTSGGCRCRVKRKRCHPSCRDCH